MKRRNLFGDLTRKRKSTTKIDSPSTSSDDAITVLCLNDDCLLEVFKWLDLPELCAVADTCSRFRQYAEAYFGHSKKKNLLLPDDILGDADSINQALLKTSRALRHFGKYIVNFSEKMNNRMCGLYNRANNKSRLMYRRKIIELLNQYCSGHLIELKFAVFDFNNEAAHMMNPLLGSIHQLAFRYCGISELLLTMLPSWCPELRGLQLQLIKDKLPFGSLRPMRKLEEISLIDVIKLNDDHIKLMLERNPQLRKVELLRCDRLTNITFAQLASEVETMNLSIFGRCHALDSSRYFGRLNNLKSLTLKFNSTIENAHFMALAIQEIGNANIPLRYLRLFCANMSLHAGMLVDGIIKLKKLETLKLTSIVDLNASHVEKICKHCTELSVLELSLMYIADPDLILNMIRIAKKLKSLTFVAFVKTFAKTCIEVDTYKEMIKIVENRCNNTHLEIKLDNRVYSSNVPQDLVRAHKQTLSFQLMSFTAWYIAYASSISALVPNSVSKIDCQIWHPV